MAFLMKQGQQIQNAASYRLFLLGFTTLFLELALIRYLAGNIYNLGYFPNLVLMAVFIGMGIGFVFHQHLTEQASRWSYTSAFFILLLVIVFVYFHHPVVPGFNTWVGKIGGEVFFTSVQQGSGKGDIVIFLFLFLAIVLLFSLISQRTAKYFRQYSPLKAYTIDIAGSCCGILSFMLISWLQMPAYLWFVMLIPLAVTVHEAQPRVSRLLLYVPLAIIPIFVWQQDFQPVDAQSHVRVNELHWSPYQKVAYVSDQQIPGIYVNGIGHQAILTSEQIQHNFYRFPYAFRNKENQLPPHRSILIIGAGSGNDVTAALQNGAEHVDAVEIDPVIAAFGQDHHPAHPYQDRRVNLIIDDGRAFMVNTTRKYDFIIFALTDSLVKVSPVAQLRLENYVFTKESVKRAYDLLNASGYLIFYNFYRLPFIYEKIRAMVYQATGNYPVSLYKSQELSMMIVGRGWVTAQLLTNRSSGIQIPTDDWPFLYLQDRKIPALYANAMLILGGFILLLSFVLNFLSKANHEEEETGIAVKLAFVFMGVAFLLLETKSVIQFSLLFGTTWLNNSLVFLSVLIFVLLANWTARLLKQTRSSYWIYGMLIFVCLVGLMFPLGSLLSVQNRVLRFVLASALTFSPIYFANLIFSITFRDQPLAENLFGWNLIGAAFGGILEYTSMVLGYNTLAILVIVCYMLVFMLLKIHGVPRRVYAGAFLNVEH